MPEFKTFSLFLHANTDRILSNAQKETYNSYLKHHIGMSAQKNLV